jgi:anti-sigma factor RsiW
MKPQPHDLELLSAYVDGELNSEDSARVERLLATDGEARARVEALRRADALARQVLDAQLTAPVSDALRANVQAAIVRARNKKRGGQGAAPERRFSLLAWLGLDAMPRFALAASTVVAVVGVLGYALGARLAATDESARFGVLAASGAQAAALSQALGAAPSGAKQVLPSGATFEAVASFRDASGALCREFKLMQAAQPGALAVACRGTQGWSVNFATVAAGAADGYAPAASPTAALDAYVSSIGGGAPLSPDEEAKALSTR